MSEKHSTVKIDNPVNVFLNNTSTFDVYDDKISLTPSATIQTSNVIVRVGDVGYEWNNTVIPSAFDNNEFSNIGSNIILKSIPYTKFPDKESIFTSNLINIQEPTVTSGGTITAEPIDADYKYLMFPYSGEADTKDYTVNFPEETECDILIVGGGGGGGPGHGGGGGAGQLVLIHNATLNGNYNINVGKGGIGGRSSELANSFPATKGSNSSFNTVIAEGGGANTNTASDKNGGSGAGGDGWTNDGGTSNGGNSDTTIDIFPNANVYRRGNNGAAQVGIVGTVGGVGGGGGGAGAAGNGSIGGNGLSGITEINYDFKTNFGNNGKLETDNKYWFAGGGGGGNSTSSGGKGGGGNGTNSNTVIPSAIQNTGSGGGGGSGGSGTGGNGGSGIVIIRYKFKIGSSDTFPIKTPGILKYLPTSTNTGNWDITEDSEVTYKSDFIFTLPKTTSTLANSVYTTEFLFDPNTKFIKNENNYNYNINAYVISENQTDKMKYCFISIHLNKTILNTNIIKSNNNNDWTISYVSNTKKIKITVKTESEIESLNIKI